MSNRDLKEFSNLLLTVVARNLGKFFVGFVLALLLLVTWKLHLKWH